MIPRQKAQPTRDQLTWHLKWSNEQILSFRDKCVLDSGRTAKLFFSVLSRVFPRCEVICVWRCVQRLSTLWHQIFPQLWFHTNLLHHPTAPVIWVLAWCTTPRGLSSCAGCVLRAMFRCNSGSGVTPCFLFHRRFNVCPDQCVVRREALCAKKPSFKVDIDDVTGIWRILINSLRSQVYTSKQTRTSSMDLWLASACCSGKPC